MKKVDQVPVRKKVDMKQWEVLTYAVSERNFLTMKKVDQVPVREKVDMKQWEVPTYAVSARNLLTVEKIDQVPVREKSRHEAMENSYICCIITKYSHREKSKGTSAWKKVDMKQREVPVYAVSERNSLTVIKVDKVPVREISRHEATKSSYICCINKFNI